MSQSAIDHLIATLRQTLGDRVGDRLQRLSESQAGWDGRDDQPLRLRSLENLVTLSQALTLPREDLGLFLEHSGNLVINWPAVNGSQVDVSIGPCMLEVCTDALNLELVIDDPLLAQRIAEIRF